MTEAIRAEKRSGWRQLTEEQVREIRELYATGEITQQELGFEFDVEQSTVSKVVRRATWRKVN